MNQIKSQTVKKLNLNHMIIDNNKSWFNMKNIVSNDQIDKLYNNVCQEHQHKNKWILMINPEEETLENLAKIKNIDTTKILRVNIKESMFNLKNIKNTLTQGNCSAVILSHTHLALDEISELSNCAKQGETLCIVLNNSATLH